MYKPLISIIIPNYNHQDYIEQRIQSVLNQSYDNKEIILLDDASSDDSPEILEKYKNHKDVKHLEINKINSGSSFIQWQKGISLAKGEWVWIAESDDYADTDFLNTLVLNIKDDIGLVYCSSKIVDDKGNDTILWGFSSMPESETYHEFKNDFISDGNSFIDRYMIKDNFIPNASGVIFRKSLIDETIFSLITNKKLLGDWLFWIDLIKKTKLAYIAQPLNYFRTHLQTVRSISEKINIQFKEYFYILDYFSYSSKKKEQAIDRLIYLYLHLSNVSKEDKRRFFKLIIKNKRLMYYYKSKINKRKNT